MSHIHTAFIYFLTQAFLCLQGVEEPTRYKYLSQVVSLEPDFTERTQRHSEEREAAHANQE